MRSLQSMRNQSIRLGNALRSTPNIRQVYAGQSRQISPAEMLAQESVPLGSLQFEDGSFKFLLGYSALDMDGL